MQLYKPEDEAVYNDILDILDISSAESRCLNYRNAPSIRKGLLKQINMVVKGEWNNENET